MDIKASLVEFLKNRDVRDIIFSIKGDRQTYLCKVKYNDTTDFIYGCYGYRESPLSFKGKLEGQGFIHYPTMMLNAAGYEMRSMIGFESNLSEYGFVMTDETIINSRYNEMLRSAVIKIVEDQGLFDAVREGKIEPKNDNHVYMIESAKERAKQGFVDHQTEILYVPYLRDINKLTSDEVVAFLDNDTKFVNTRAAEYYAKESDNISDSILLNYMANKELEGMNNGNGIHTDFRAMADSITDQKTLTLDILRDGKSLTVKYDAERLKWSLKGMDGKPGNWNMDAPSRKQFETLFGRHEDMRVIDIVAIRYGKKTLWERN